MYLSKLILNRSSAYIRYALQNIDMMHKDILHVFESTRAENHVLFRIIESQFASHILVQSDILPDWSSLAFKGYILEDVRSIDSIESLFLPGRRFSFSVLVNPRSEIQNHRTYIKDPALRIDWLRRKAEQYGFDLIKVVETSTCTRYVRKDTGHFGINFPEFKGVLQIKDPRKFKECFQNGIGPGKAYGCGLLLLSAA